VSLSEADVGGAASSAKADALRETMIKGLVEQEGLSDRVAAAFRAVPRHVFAPEVSLEDAYANDVVITKRDERGIALSSVSAPWLQAMMLEQAQIQPGMRVLEVGSGGFNAALLAELAGESGAVTTVDIDPEVVDRASHHLAEAGYQRVNVVLTDAEGGVPAYAPYDRVIVTVGAWDIPPAWVDQLTRDGLLVVPLVMRGLTRSVILQRDGDHLTSRGYRLCGFVAMQGAGAHHARLVLLPGDEVALRVDGDLAVPVDGHLLGEALRTDGVERWSEVEVGGVESFDDLDLWIAANTDGFCLLAAKQAAIDRGVAPKSARLGVATMVSAGGLAFRISRPVRPGGDRWEFGVRGHGPDGVRLAEEYIELVRGWDREQRGGAGASIAVYPAATPDADLPAGRVIDKRHTRLVISWPATGRR
jgi:protein-L-isoaspartate(D-aspartate) O-methyltransferase